MILSTIKSKLIAAGATVALLTVSGMLVYSYIENRHLTKVNGDLTSQINDPVSGFRVVLAKEQANRANLEAAVERQNSVIVRQAVESKRRLADTTAQLATAQRSTRAAQARVAVLLATPPKGDTLAERMADVDARVLEALK